MPHSASPGLHPIVNVPSGTNNISMLLEVSLILHANPLATIAARRFASVTTVGSGAVSNRVAHVGTMMYVNAFVAVAVPFGVVTATLFAPTVPAGVTAVTLVQETATRLVAATPPTVTLVAPVRFVPVIVIVVPPAVEPDGGVIDVIVVGPGVLTTRKPL